MYTTDRAEQALGDIRKVFLLYECGIIKDSQVRDLTYKIADKIRNTLDMVEAIDAGKCGLVFRDYEKDGQTHTTVDFVDYVPTDYAE